MAKFQHMKAFNAATTEYLRNPYGVQQCTTLQIHLDAMRSSTDLDIFEPGSAVAEEFFMSLYKLTNMLDTNTPYIWYTFDVLHRVCDNPAAKQALIHTYNFAPIISRILSTDCSPDETVIILKLLQQLTSGIKIYEKETYLSPLFKTLTHLMTKSSQENIVALALEIVTNLCYNNPPAIDTFVNHTSIKNVYKTLAKRQSSNIHCRVYYTKLLLITEQSTDNIPDTIILDFVMMTFSNLLVALTHNENHLVQHIVTFFEDMRENEHTRKVMTIYAKYSEDVKKILQQFNSEINAECSAAIMDLFVSLVKLKNSTITPLYPEFIKAAMELVFIEKASSKALALIKTLLVDTKRSKIFSSLIAELDIGALMALLTPDNCGESNREMNLRLTELVQVCQEIIKVPDCKGQVIELLNENMVREWLSPILDNGDAPSVVNCLGNHLENPTTALYIHVLVMTSDLAMQNSNWQALFSELMKRKQIQIMIALAMFTQEADVKQKCFQLVSAVGLSQDSITSIAKYMSEFEPFLLIQNRSGIVAGISKNPNNRSLASPALITSAEREKVCAVLKTLEDLEKADKIADMSASQVIELYSLELNALKDSEKKTQNDLEQANNRATLFQQRLALVSSETGRCRALFFSCQEKLDKLQTKLATVQANVQSSEKINSMQIQEIQSLKKIVTEKSSRVEQLSARIKEIEEESERKIKQLKEDHIAAEKLAEEFQEQTRKLEKLIEDADANLQRKRQTLKAKDKELETLQANLHLQKQENEELMRQCRTYAQTLSEKEENIEKLSSELNSFAQMRDTIFQLTAKTRDDSKNDTA